MANNYENLRRKSMSIYRVSDTQPNWEQDDPSQPDYIKNKELAQEVRPIQVNGEEILSANPESGPINFVAGRNVALVADGNSIVITAAGGAGGEGGDEVVEGDGIDITLNALGQKIISLEPGAITDDYIQSISIEKIAQQEGTKLILNGGNANG